MENDKLYIHHILDAIEEIEQFTQQITFQKFENSRLLQNGVIRELEIIGEASKRLTLKIKNEIKEIPWKAIAGMRDKLIHDYAGVNLEAVWRTVKEDIPQLKKSLHKYEENAL